MHVETSTSANPQLPLVLSSIYRALSIVFFAVAVLTFFVSLYDLGKHLQKQSVLFLGYAVLGFLLSIGLWSQKKWVVSLFALNALGVIFLKSFWMLQGSGNWKNIIISVLVALSFAIGTYLTREKLRANYVEPRFLTVFVLCWIIIIENSAIR